jgi:hypothetical protein
MLARVSLCSSSSTAHLAIVLLGPRGVAARVFGRIAPQGQGNPGLRTSRCAVAPTPPASYRRSVGRITAASVANRVARERPRMPLWRAYDVSGLLGVDMTRLREITRRAGINRGATFSLDEVRGVVVWQLRGGTDAESVRAVEALAALDAAAWAR